MLPNGLRYWRVGRADSLDRQKKLEARKMLEKPHRTHPSSARFVRQPTMNARHIRDNKPPPHY
jgi:hypothetical protein